MCVWYNLCYDITPINNHSNLYRLDYSAIYVKELYFAVVQIVKD